jgi:uncharacterized membrane-anchored protein
MNWTVRLPADHPLRRRLAGEVHARPPVPVPLPAVASAIALLRPEGADDLAPLRALAASAGVAFGEPEHPHLVLELPGLRVKWERHTEFTSHVFVRAPQGRRLAELEELPSAFAALPADWLASLAGETVAAVDVTLLPAAEEGLEALARYFAAPTLVGSRIADGAARVFTDFQTTADGRCRWLVLDQGLSAGQRARVVQRLVEIETYRVMAMLAFPRARELAIALGVAEARLAAITARSAELAGKPLADATREERQLLDELMRLGAECEQAVAASAFRFSAARAYWEIVGQRVAELREARGEGLPTVGEFLARRLAPAMATVAATARRQREVSARVARAGNLMRTRVDLAREEQNQRLLAAMERRGKLSLRLQQTVEGLSVAAITYYAVGLLGVLVRPLERIWPGLEAQWVSAAAVPVLGFAIWRAVRRIRRELASS